MKTKTGPKVKPRRTPKPVGAVSSAAERPSDSRSLLIQVAKDLFAEHGYEGVSIRDIVDAAGVNVSLVSYYFGGKEGLLETCLQESGRRHLQLAEREFQPPATREAFEESVKRFVLQYFETRLAEISSVRLASAEMEKNSDVFQRFVKTIFIQTLGVMTSFFVVSQAKGFVRPDLEPRELANMLHGQLNFQLRTNHVRSFLTGLSLEDEATRRMIAHQISSVFLGGVR